MSLVGGSHKPPYHVERRFMRASGQRARTLEPGTRVVVRPLPGASNPYEGRMGEIVDSEQPEGPEGETLYRVLLDFALPGEEPGAPVEVFAAELRPTYVPKPENVTATSAPRPNRRLHEVGETYRIGGVQDRGNQR